ncbi:LysR family transcriptional regulator [Ruegeria atlantica]|uniref:LysR family transcriptional regulator n=1 Tax=Ruegeria atlantica TaxID=81569 RepID=UPI00147EA983|nr:LysR family transcriptional regulator [Ruegeria atlantica]
MADNFSTLRLFARVARTGSFTAAGKEVGLSQPSVSRIISNLEKDLGVLLFARSTHAVRPTEAGEEYLTRIEPIIADIEEANHFVRGTGELRGKLRIGAATSFAQREIIPVLPAFLAQHPKLKVDLVLTDSRQDLIDEAIDVAIRYGPLDDSTMVARKLGDPPRIIAASPAYLARAGHPKQPADLVDHQIVLGPSSRAKAGWSFEKDGKVQSIRVDGRVMITVNEGTTVAALAGMGVVNTALWGCRAEIENGSLVRLLPDWDLGTIEVHALLSGGKRTKPSARAFTKHLQQALSNA